MVQQKQVIMTQDEILQCNKLIAEFMGIHTTKDGITTNLRHDNGQKAIYHGCWTQNQVWSVFLNSQIYNKSWDWLIPVIDKIKSMNEYPKFKQHTSSMVNEGGIHINTKFIINTIVELKCYRTMKDTIIINLRALDEDGRNRLEKLLDYQLNIIEDDTNEEALDILRKFKED